MRGESLTGGSPHVLDAKPDSTLLLLRDVFVRSARRLRMIASCPVMPLQGRGGCGNTVGPLS